MKATINVNFTATDSWSQMESAVFDSRFQLEYFEKPRSLAGVFDEARGLNGKVQVVTSVGPSTMDRRESYYSDAKREQPKLARTNIEIFDYVREVPADQLLDNNSGSQGQILASYARTVAETYKTQEDKIVWDALRKATIQEFAIGKIGDKQTALSLDTIITASLYLDQKGAPMSERYAIASSELKDKILVMDKATNANYVELKALVTGEFKEYLGYKWIWVNPDVTGFSTKGNESSYIYFIQKDCCKQLWGAKTGTTVYYEPKCYCNIINAVLQCGAAVLRPNVLSCIKFGY